MRVPPKSGMFNILSGSIPINNKSRVFVPSFLSSFFNIQLAQARCKLWVICFPIISSNFSNVANLISTLWGMVADFFMTFCIWARLLSNGATASKKKHILSWNVSLERLSIIACHDIFCPFGVKPGVWACVARGVMSWLTTSAIAATWF